MILKSPFPIGVYCGIGKPSSVNQFSKKFVREVVVLKEEGLTLHVITIPTKISGVVCDAQARFLPYTVYQNTQENTHDPNVELLGSIMLFQETKNVESFLLILTSLPVHTIVSLSSEFLHGLCIKCRNRYST